MKTSLLLNFLCIVMFNYVSCTEEQNPVSTDISVTAVEDLIIWMDESDLAEKIEQGLIYNLGKATENEVNKTQGFNTDTTQLIARVFLKTEFSNAYFDPDITNNTITIQLEKMESNSGPVLLNADGPGDTYELITAVLAPEGDPVEPPDCSHADFGRHIDEEFDTELDKHIFRFHIHVEPDNDRCINFDRQRNEIKTYDKSPAKLKGIEGETVEYRWKFKLPAGFQSSTNFTHIHQLKSVGGAYHSMPMYTLTTRKSNPDVLQLRYAELDKQSTIAETELAPFIDEWVEVTETIKYGVSGNYEIEIRRIRDGEILFRYSNENSVNWREGADFVRPKWGVYRSLINAQELRDETVLFADFSIEEL